MKGSYRFYKFKNSQGALVVCFELKDEPKNIPIWLSKESDGGDISLLVAKDGIAALVTINPKEAIGPSNPVK